MFTNTNKLIVQIIQIIIIIIISMYNNYYIYIGIYRYMHNVVIITKVCNNNNYRT